MFPNVWSSTSIIYLQELFILVSTIWVILHAIIDLTPVSTSSCPRRDGQQAMDPERSSSKVILQEYVHSYQIFTALASINTLTIVISQQTIKKTIYNSSLIRSSAFSPPPTTHHSLLLLSYILLALSNHVLNHERSHYPFNFLSSFSYEARKSAAE